MVTLPKYSIGVGDRFAHEAEAQLSACEEALRQGTPVAPVWNKSHREHGIVGSEPISVREAADRAVKRAGWKEPYFVDADHITMATVDGYIESADYFTIDVADKIGQPAEPAEIDAFLARHPELAGEIEVDGLEAPIRSTPEELRAILDKYLAATQEAARIYRRIEERKGAGAFVTEVSMDETDDPQRPAQLLLILAALADFGVPVQTIAPKFPGRFNKGVDYVGDLERFDAEFRSHLAVIEHAAMRYGLPSPLKISVHSGSDKFSLYPVMRRAILDRQAGLHLKTAGTTWLEELIGLAISGGEGLALAKEIYVEALAHREELCAPYAAVIDIDSAKLPSAKEAAEWDDASFVAAIRHDPKEQRFNPHARQLLHVGYKVAAKQGVRYLDLLRSCRQPIASAVKENLLDRHIRPLFLG